jgi:putative oxidoreductase
MALLDSLGKYKNFGLLVMRVGLGIMFVYHGYPKLLGGPQKWEELGNSTKYLGVHFLPVVWGFLSAVVETFGGFLLAIGLIFRPVCLLLIINLIVATFFHLHQSGPMGGLMGASHAIEDGVTFLGLLFLGPGRYSVDRK